MMKRIAAGQTYRRFGRTLARGLSTALLGLVAASLMLQGAQSAGGQLPDLESVLGMRSPGSRTAAGLFEIKAPPDFGVVFGPLDPVLPPLAPDPGGDPAANSPFSSPGPAPDAQTPFAPLPVPGALYPGFGTQASPLAGGDGFAAGEDFARDFAGLLNGGGGSGGGGGGLPGPGGPPAAPPPAAIPDVETWQSLIAGLALIGGLARRRRRTRRRVRHR